MTDENLPAVYQPRPATDSWVEVISDASKLAAAIASTEFVPKSYRGRSEATLATILHGRELGLGPMTSLALTDSIQGIPSIKAEGARALYLAAGHELEILQTTSAICEVRGRRKGSETWQHVTWTTDDARLAGLLGKDAWKGHPRRMLQARATAELIRLIAPDVLHGLPTVDEAEDMADSSAAQPVTVTTTKVQKPAKPRPKLEPIDRQADPAPDEAPAPLEIDVEPPPAPEPEPAPPADVVVDAEIIDGPPPTAPSPGPKRATAAQLKMLGVLWSKLGVSDDEKRRWATSQLVHRELADGSTKDLTANEASDLIEALTRCADADDPRAAVRALVEGATQTTPDPGEDTTTEGSHRE